MGEMNNRELFEMHQGITSEGPYVNPTKPPMTKQEAIKKAIEVMYNNKHPYKSQSTTVSGAYIDYRQFAQVAQQIIEELGYE
jgi:hypothetical protein